MNVSNELKINSNEFIKIILTRLREKEWVILLILSRDIAIRRDFLITPLDIIIIIVLRALKAFEILINVNLIILEALKRVDMIIINI